MIKFTNECCSCDRCTGGCSLRHTPHLICDICHEEIDVDEKLYDYAYRAHYCKHCFAHHLAKEGHSEDEILKILDDYLLTISYEDVTSSENDDYDD